MGRGPWDGIGIVMGIPQNMWIPIHSPVTCLMKKGFPYPGGCFES